MRAATSAVRGETHRPCGTRRKPLLSSVSYIYHRRVSSAHAARTALFSIVYNQYSKRNAESQYIYIKFGSSDEIKEATTPMEVQRLRSSAVEIVS